MASLRSFSGSGVALALLCALLAVTSRPAQADELKNRAIEAGVAIGAVGAAIGVGVVLLVKHKPTKTGCVAAGNSGGLALKDDSDGKSYVLRGDIAGISAGQRVRVSGKQRKHADPAEFDVVKLKKTIGACPVS